MRAVVLAALLCAPLFLQAQQTPGSSGLATVSGVAVDSIRGGYLRGAIVSVSGTTRSAITDSAGRFRIDSVDSGARYLEVMHPLLDSLSLKVRTPPRELKAGETVAFILAVPSPSTIVAAKCTAEEIARGGAAVVGTVHDADTEAPSIGAIVSAEWTDYQLSRRSMNRIPQRRTATVRADGAYRLCGIPDDLITGVIASRGADSTGIVPVNFGNKLAVVAFQLPATASAGPVAARSPTDSTATAVTPKGSAVLTGRVLDASGTPLASARVAVEADEAVTTTNNEGRFRLTGLRAGTRTLAVRRIGFASADVPVDVSMRTARDVTVNLSRYVAVLDAVRVTAMREIGLQRVGFAERSRSASGKFVGPEEIERRNPQRLIHVLETAPSLRMATTATGRRYVTGRHNGCVRYFVDGFRWFTAAEADVDMSPDAFLSGAEIGAIEIYDELSAPPEFMRLSNRGQPCSVVVIWTKQKLGT